MSQILDALRGAKPRAAAAPRPKSIRTPTALKTLGQEQSSPATRLGLPTKIVAYITLLLTVIYLFWWVALWVTTTYLDRQVEPQHFIAQPSSRPTR
jgi:hypothetical protein